MRLRRRPTARQGREARRAACSGDAKEAAALVGWLAALALLMALLWLPLA